LDDQQVHQVRAGRGGRFFLWRDHPRISSPAGSRQRMSGQGADSWGRAAARPYRRGWGVSTKSYGETRGPQKVIFSKRTHYFACRLVFLKKRRSCYSSSDGRRGAPLPAGRGACFRRARGAKICSKAKIPFFACKPLISHRTDEGIFGNIWRKGAQIWKCLARACKG